MRPCMMDTWDSLFKFLVLTNVISWIPISCTRTPARAAPRNDLWNKMGSFLWTLNHFLYCNYCVNRWCSITVTTFCGMYKIRLSPYPKDMFATRIPDRVLANTSFSLCIVLCVANLTKLSYTILWMLWFSWTNSA